MDNNGNGIKWRRSEFISFGTLSLLAIWIWYASAKVSLLEETVRNLNEVKPIIETHSQELAVLMANVSDIKEDIKYLRRNLK